LTRKRLSTAYVVRGRDYVEARMRLSDLSWEKTIGVEGLCTVGAWRIEEMKVYSEIRGHIMQNPNPVPYTQERGSNGISREMSILQV
jgi:hypothetical protein